MGGKQSKPNGGAVEVLAVNHPRFQNLKLVKNKDNEDCIQVQVSVANSNEYDAWVSALKEVPAFQENFLLPLSHSFQKQGFCGSSGLANIVFQKFPYILSDQIKNRSQLEQRLFEEPELWYLIYTLIEAGHEFHKTGKKIGDVRPENVFINQDGQVKISTHLTWPNEQSNYHKTFYEKEATYLAPQELKDIQFAKIEPSCDWKAAESFSIGLTCLDAGTLGSSTSLYQKNSKFDYNGLTSRLQELQHAGYSQILRIVLANICEPDSEKRNTCSEMFQWLQPYSESIINLEPFTVNELPPRAQAQTVQHTGVVQNIVRPHPGPLIQGQYSGGSSVPLTYINQINQVNHQIQPPQRQQIVSVPPMRIQQGQVIQQFSQPISFSPPKYYQAPPIQVYQQGVINSRAPQIQNSQHISQNNGTGEFIDNRITSNYTYYSQIPPPTPPGPQQFRHGDSNIAKSNIEMTLQKIDEQLQMSRKMFPS